MYGREYGGRVVEFEASGGLVNSSLVMQDRQTDTYWSIMEGEAVAGELEGQVLEELNVGEKIQWRHWRARHPETLVLSVEGREDAGDAYRSYFREELGYRGQTATDSRLETKASIYAFHYAGKAYAVPQSRIETGRSYRLPDGSAVFLYREAGASMHRSTSAFISSAGFVLEDGVWRESGSGARFDAETRRFPGVTPLGGFDTFWYNFSLNNPETTLLE